MDQVSFKERVKNVAINEAKTYKENYVDYEYLVCSNAFEIKDYYILDAKEDNYQHLIGVHSLIKPQEFFDKCYNGTLLETDFDFQKRGQSEKSVKGSVREKITILSDAMNLFSKNIKVEETFSKNYVSCSFATADDNCTLGFINTTKSRPMTLLKGNELKADKAKSIDLLLRKEAGKEKFNEIIIGNTEILMSYYEKIKEHIDESLILPLINKEVEEHQDTTQKEVATSDMDKQLNKQKTINI